MRCPSCEHPETKVVDSRPSESGGVIRRRRECLDCKHRFTTYESLAEAQLFAIKSNGSTEPFDREKLMRGGTIACAKRPVSPEQITEPIDTVEAEIKSSARQNISSAELGDIMLAHLREIDDVAFIRFASVYKDFKTVEEFARVLEAI